MCPGPNASAWPLEPASTIALAPIRFTSIRATGQVSAHDHGLVSRPVAIVAVNARCSNTCESHALAWMYAPCPNRIRPATAKRRGRTSRFMAPVVVPSLRGAKRRSNPAYLLQRRKQDCFASLAMTVSERSVARAALSRVVAARAWQGGGWGNLLLSSASEGGRLTAGDQEQCEGDEEQDDARDHHDLGVGSRLRQHDCGGRGCHPGSLQRRVLEARIVVRASFERLLQLPAFAEHLVEIPARRQVERQFGELQRLAIGAARCLVDRNEAGEPRHELMLERKRENGLVGFLGRRLPRGAADLGIGDLAGGPQFRQA